MVRVALVGCGVISADHVRGYAAHPERARITACCDVDLAKAAACAERVTAVWGEEVRITDVYASVLADPDIDSIELCTPSHLHADAAISAARAGKHVSCQKPLALTLGDCDRMIKAAEASGTVLYYAEIFRAWPLALAAQRLISEGRIGRLVGLQATYAQWQGGAYADTAWRYDPRIAGGGQLIDGGIHHIDLLRTLGGPIRSVSCFTNRIRPELGGEDSAVVNFRFEGGHLGTLMSTHASAVWFPGPSLAVMGTEGLLTLGGGAGALVLHRRDLPDGRQVVIADRPDVFASMVGHYLDVLAGAPSLCSPESGRELLQIVLAAYRSAETGREVRVDEVVA